MHGFKRCLQNIDFVNFFIAHLLNSIVNSMCFNICSQFSSYFRIHLFGVVKQGMKEIAW